MANRELRRFRWRDYRTASGARPVNDFIRGLPDEHVIEVVAAMREVARSGLTVARHVRGEVYEVRVESHRQAFRILLARETAFILLSLSAFQKKTRKVPRAEIALAEARWRSGGSAAVRWRRRHVIDAMALEQYSMKMPKDFLDEVVAERTRKNPRFPAMLSEAEHRLALGRTLASLRTKASLSQTLVAARMGTAASVVSKLEAGADVKVSTLQRYCAAIGQEFPPRIKAAASTKRAA